MTHVTQHAKRRGKERLGLPARALARLLPRVLKHGTPRTDYRGRVRKYLDGIANDPFHRAHQPGPVDVRVYGEHVFLFDQDRLITILHVPRALRSALR